MNSMLKFLIIILITATNFSFSVSAGEAEDNITREINRLLPGETITRIRTTPFKDLYEVILGPNVLYMSGDGRYVLRGDLLDMQERSNLSENERSSARREIFSRMKSDEYIEFAPDHPKHTLYVFTDIDCAYCRRLHRDVPVLNQNDIAVRYLAYPRGGPGSLAFEKMQAVWCSKDRQKALTDAKSGQLIASNECKNPVASEYELGRKFGIHGTPAIYTEQGEELSGYMPPDELMKAINK